MNLLNNDEIIGHPIHKGRDKRVTYAATPIFLPDDIPAGRSAHIGNGVFRSSCAGGCGAYVDTWGPQEWIYELRHHEHDEHGLDVPGVTLGMLP